MSEPKNNHPDSERVDLAPEGDGVDTFPPCCDTGVFIPIDRAVPGARLRLVCPASGEAWLVELAADDTAESCLRAVWTDAAAGAGEDR